MTLKSHFRFCGRQEGIFSHYNIIVLTNITSGLPHNRKWDFCGC